MNNVNRFFSYVSYSDDCWEWQGGLNRPDGYGKFYCGGSKKYILAHRWSYHYFIGDLGTLLCCHHCDNRKCVNPFHLFSGAHKDNMQDCSRKGRTNYGGAPLLNSAKTHCKRGHPYSGNNLVVYESGKRFCRECRKLYNKRAEEKMKADPVKWQRFQKEKWKREKQRKLEVSE